MHQEGSNVTDSVYLRYMPNRRIFEISSLPLRHRALSSHPSKGVSIISALDARAHRKKAKGAKSSTSGPAARTSCKIRIAVSPRNRRAPFRLRFIRDVLFAGRVLLIILMHLERRWGECTFAYEKTGSSSSNVDRSEGWTDALEAFRCLRCKNITLGTRTKGVGVLTLCRGSGSAALPPRVPEPLATRESHSLPRHLEHTQDWI